MNIVHEQIAQDIIRRLGVRRAKEGTRPIPPAIPNKTGFEGVDFTGGKYRAQIRFSDALSGQDTRITLGRFDSAESAGMAYRAAHIHLWGALSYFLGGVGI